MENIEKNTVETTRAADFDQSVDELAQLEAEEKEKPDNAKIKQYLEEVRNHIDKLLKELDEAPVDRDVEAIGRRALDTAVEQPAETYADNTQKMFFADSQGFVHNTAADARANEPDRWQTNNQ